MKEVILMGKEYTERSLDQSYSIASAYVAYLHRKDTANITIEDFLNEVEEVMNKVVVL